MDYYGTPFKCIRTFSLYLHFQKLNKTLLDYNILQFFHIFIQTTSYYVQVPWMLLQNTRVYKAYSTNFLLNLINNVA